MAQYITTSLYNLDDNTDGFLRQPFPAHVEGITDMSTYFHGNFTNSQTGFGKCLTQNAGWEFGNYKFFSNDQLEALLGMGEVGGLNRGGNFIIEWKAYTPTEGPLGPVNTILVNPSNIQIPGIEIFRYATRAGFYIKVFISKTVQNINDVPLNFVNNSTTVSLLAVFPDGTYSTSSANISGMAGNWHNFRIVKDAHEVKFYTDNSSTCCNVDVEKAFEIDQYGSTAWFRPMSFPVESSAITTENYFSFYSSETGYCIDEVRTLLCGFEIYNTFPVNTTPSSPLIPNISSTNIAKISVGDVIDPTAAFPYGATVIEVGTDYIVLSQPAAIQLSGGNLTIRAKFPDVSTPAKLPYIASEIQRIGEITVGDTKITELKYNPTTKGYSSFISSLGLLNDSGSGKVFVKFGEASTAWKELVQKGNITLSEISQSGATTGQTPSWSGTAWVATTPASSEPTITAGTTSQYWRGDKTWQTLDKSAIGLSNVPNTDATIASNITQDSTHRFVTDTQISTWNSPSGANTSLSNIADTSVSADLIPSTDSSKSFGSNLKRWLSIFATKIVDATNVIVVNITSRLLVNAAGTSVLDFSGNNLDVLSGKITGVANGTDNTDAVNLSQLKDPTNITQDSTHRFVTDTEKTTWNSAIIPTDTAISALDVDWTAGTTFYKTLSADATLTFSNTTSGKIITVVISNSSASYINISFPAGVISTGTGVNGYIEPGASRAFIFEKSNGGIYCLGPSFPFQVSLSTFSGSTVWPLVKSYFGSQNTTSPNPTTMTIPCIGSKNGDIITVAVANTGNQTLTVTFTASDATAVTFFAGNGSADGVINSNKTALFTLYRINNNIRIRKDVIV